jgi:hypothetical protein
MRREAVVLLVFGETLDVTLGMTSVILAISVGSNYLRDKTTRYVRMPYPNSV